MYRKVISIDEFIDFDNFIDIYQTLQMFWDITNVVEPFKSLGQKHIKMSSNANHLRKSSKILYNKDG
jgi:hypothetical protein